MIQDEQQYKASKAQLARFAAALERLQLPESFANAHPLLKQAFKEGAQSLHDEILKEIHQYEQNLSCSTGKV